MPTTSDQPQSPPDENGPTLTISPEKVCFVIIKAPEFDAKDEVTEPDPGSNPTDDKDTAVLEDHEDDPVVEELTSFIDSLSEDEQIDLVALTWLGRDDYTASNWNLVREEASRAQKRARSRLSFWHTAGERLPRRGPFDTRVFLRGF
jgi:hypothetical protein